MCKNAETFKSLLYHNMGIMVPLWAPGWGETTGQQYRPLVRGIHWSAMDYRHTGPLMWSFGVSFVVSLNKLLFKQLNWWVEIAYCSCDMTVLLAFWMPSFDHFNFNMICNGPITSYGRGRVLVSIVYKFFMVCLASLQRLATNVVLLGHRWHHWLGLWKELSVHC